jgi:hypothetical protein
MVSKQVNDTILAIKKSTFLFGEVLNRLRLKFVPLNAQNTAIFSQIPSYFSPINEHAQSPIAAELLAEKL